MATGFDTLDYLSELNRAYATLSDEFCLRIPAHHEHSFWFIVNTYFGRT